MEAPGQSPLEPRLLIALDARDTERERIGALDALLREDPAVACEALQNLPDTGAVTQLAGNLAARETPPQSARLRYKHQVIEGLSAAFRSGIDLEFCFILPNRRDPAQTGEYFVGRDRLRVERIKIYLAALVAAQQEVPKEN